MQNTTISFSVWTIVKILLVLLGLWVLYITRQVIVMFFIAAILATVFHPAVSFFERKKIPRAVGILLVYGILFALLGFVIGFIIPPVVSQLKELTAAFPSLWQRVITAFSDFQILGEERTLPQNIQQLFRTIETNLTQIGRGIVSGIFTLFGGLFSFLIILVLTFYLLSQTKEIEWFFRSLIPERFHGYSFELFQRFQKKLRRFATGQVILSLYMFLIIFIGLTLLNVKYALSLALFAGFLEFIPYFGPVFAAFLATILAVTQSPTTGLFVFVLFVAANQVENYIIVPKLIQKMVGLNPVISIIALMAGFKLAGFVGIVLAIPVALFVSIIVKEFFLEAKEEK